MSETSKRAPKGYNRDWRKAIPKHTKRFKEAQGAYTAEPPPASFGSSLFFFSSDLAFNCACRTCLGDPGLAADPAEFLRLEKALTSGSSFKADLSTIS